MQSNIIPQNENKSVTLPKDFLRSNLKLGMEEVTPDDLPTPTLTLVQSNSQLVDNEGRPLPRGHFYYKGTGQTFQSVDCTFLSLTKKELPDFSNKEELVKTYVMLGVIDPDYKPFLMYFKRTGIGVVKQFLGKINAMQLPMFSLGVTLSSEKVEGDKGTYYKIKIDVNGLHLSNEKIITLEKLTRKYAPEIREVSEETDGKMEVAKDIPF